MPELPEVEITARLLDRALAGAEIESVLAPGINALKTFDPPLSVLAGQKITGVGRRGKHFMVRVGGPADPLVLLIHLMSAGRLQLYDKHAGPRDRTSRLLVRIDDGRELRLREFGSKQAAWVKLLRAEELEEDPALETLGPEAWPDPPLDLGEVLHAARPLHTLLRDQRTIAGIGRSWVDEILWEAKLSPYKRGADLDAAGARDRPLRGARHAANPRQAADAAARASPRGRAVPALRNDDRVGPFRELRNCLLSHLPDGGADAEGSATVAAVEVGASPAGTDRTRFATRIRA
jgi:formamidopyrimidine-DNA glycosylase